MSLVLILAVLVLAYLLLLLTKAQQDVQAFRYDVFRVRDDVRFAFLAEISRLHKNSAERYRIRKQFPAIQEVLNAMLNYPSLSQVAFLRAMRTSTTNAYAEIDIDLPPQFRKALSELSLAILRSMRLTNRTGWLLFAFRIFVFGIVELLIQPDVLKTTVMNEPMHSPEFEGEQLQECALLFKDRWSGVPDGYKSVRKLSRDNPNAIVNTLQRQGETATKKADGMVAFSAPG